MSLAQTSVGVFTEEASDTRATLRQPAVSPVEHENDLFAHILTRYLDDARKANRYNRLYLIAPPKFLGLIRGSLDDEVKKMVQGELQKDISTLTAHEVEGYVKENIWML